MLLAQVSNKSFLQSFQRLYSYNKADHQLGHLYGSRDDSTSVFSAEKTLPLSMGISNPGYANYFNGTETLEQTIQRRKT